ncbi:MAG TPA: hypothetical protein DEH78_30385 [Solibacterales bacterium]|nr:hypothetical protein [Bryobacterales bacterium]
MRVENNLLAFVLIAAIPSWADSAAAPAPEGRLGVIADFAQDVPLSVEASLREELVRLLPLDGLEIEWRRLDRGPVGDVFVRLVVVRFRGRCSPFEPVGRFRDANHTAMAFTHVSEGRVLPYIEVDCARVLQAVAESRWRLPHSGPLVAMGRALARVVAHEIYHVIAETLEHGRDGLAKAALSGKELTTPSAQFEPEDAARMRTRLRPAVAFSFRAANTSR